MKIELNKNELLAVVKRVLPFVERKTTIPILSNLKVTANADSVSFTGTDLETSLTVTHSCRVKAEGSIAIPARKLSDVLTKIKSLEANTVEITADADKWITLSCGPLTVKLPGMDVNNYPTIPTFDGATSELNGAVLSGLIRRVRHAIATQESRYTLNGGLLVIEPNLVRMVATDGHRLAMAEHAGAFASPMRCLISTKAIALLPALLDNGPVTIAHNETNIFICANDWQLVARILVGQFPNWEAVMPKYNAKRVTVSAKQLLASVARIAAFADERSQATKWELIGGKGIQLSASNTETGDASELVSVSCEDDVTVGLCAAYITDMLGTIEKDQTVTMAVRDAQSAVLWTPGEANGFTTKYVIMPMRI